ncbi:MAG: UPF0489 family protein [Endomicrobium sp.]|nr:UPF0489 family protein [Endomicrobium sp.]
MSATLLHVDFHSDMWSPGNPIDYQFSKMPGFLKMSIYTESIYDLVENGVCITSFLLPSVLRYGFNNIIFLKPIGNEEQISEQRQIGTVNGEGKFIRNSNNKNILFLPDKKSFNYTETTYLENVNCDDYVLDIDMDFFSCNMNLLPYKSIFYTYPDKAMEEITEWNKSASKYKINLGLIKTKNNGNYVSEYPTLKPVYNDNIEWIKYSVENFIYSLKKKPKYISICRSEKSGYTPKKYVDFLEKYLIDKLNVWCVGKPKYPGDVALEVSSFTVFKDKTLYNYATEISVDLDGIGKEIFYSIDGKKTQSKLLK